MSFYPKQSEEAQPIIGAFIPKQKFDENSDLTSADLQSLIDRLEVTESIRMYELLQLKGIEIPADLKQNLLELVCYFNHTDPLPLDSFEERAKNMFFDKRKQDAGPNKWINGFGDQLFDSIQPTTPAAYNTMIRAMAKHGVHFRAIELFRKAESENVSLDCATYNSYISCIRESSQSFQRRWSEILDVLNKMKQQSLTPTAHTLHAIVSTLSGGHAVQIRQHVETILAEFDRLGIRPMLATYALLLDLYASMPTQLNAIEQILVEIEKTPELQIQTMDDMKFFPKAMEVLRFRIKDSLVFVKRINDLVRYGNNVKLLGDSSMQQVYYRHLLCAYLRQESWPEFFKVYDDIVPIVYSMEPATADEILSKINVTGAIHYIPILWRDMQIAEITKRGAVTEALLRLMLFNKPSDEIEQQQGLDEQFANIATTIFNDMIEQMESRGHQDSMLNASSVSAILVLQLRGNHFVEARKVFQKCMDRDTQRKLLSPLSEMGIMEFLDACIENKYGQTAIQCIEYGISNNMISINKYAAKLINSDILTPADVKIVKDMVGHEALKPYEQET